MLVYKVLNSHQKNQDFRLGFRFHLILRHHMSIFIEGIEFTVDEDRAVSVSFTCFRVEIVGVIINCDKAS